MSATIRVGVTAGSEDAEVLVTRETDGSVSVALVDAQGGPQLPPQASTMAAAAVSGWLQQRGETPDRAAAVQALAVDLAAGLL